MITGPLPLSDSLIKVFTMPIGEVRAPPFLPWAQLTLPPSSLHGMVERCGRYQLDPESMAHFHAYRLPEPRGDIFFLRRRSKPAWTKLMIVGAHDIYAADPIVGAESCVLLWFEPGSVGWYSGLPAYQMCNRIAPLSEIWGESGETLERHLSSIEDEAVLLAELTTALVQRPRRNWSSTCYEIITWMQRHAWGLRVPDVVRQSGYTYRQLLRMFKQHVGMTPQLVIRILRFRAVIASLKDESDHDWAGISSRAGYSDQSHFIADCVTFTGMTPRQLIHCRTLGMIFTHEMLFMPKGMIPGTLDESVVAPRNRSDKRVSSK
jgi:AraC-like DNA-binding protein